MPDKLFIDLWGATISADQILVDLGQLRFIGVVIPQNRAANGFPSESPRSFDAMPSGNQKEATVVKPDYDRV
jgi:hypothetical protein